METFFHGSTVLFKKFDLSHALEGDGKVKFGFGVYLTQRYASAAHYAFNKNRPDVHYVYTVEVPEKTDDNCLSLAKRVKVQDSVVKRAEEKLGKKIPDEAKKEGIVFRKYLANVLTGNEGTIKQMIDKATIEGEKAASEFLLSIGVEMIEWPKDWKKPEDQVNRAYIDDNKLKIVKVEEVDLDEKKHQLIEGSQKEVTV